MINGFGLQHLGTVAARNPLSATFIYLLVTIIAVFGLTKLEFSGENIEILRDGSSEMKDYDSLLTDFRNFNNDAVILMRLDNLATVEGIETFREVNFEFQLSEHVESILSIFSMVKFGGKEQGWQSALPSTFETDAQVRAALEQLAIDIPSAQSLFSKNYNSAVMIVYTTEDATRDENVQQTMHALKTLAESFETENIQFSIAGQPAIRAAMIDSILTDLIWLSPIALLLCAAIALLLFRNLTATVLCSLPSLVSVVWFLGWSSLMGMPLNFLTSILPILLIVIVFADTLHFYLKWQKTAFELSDSNSGIEIAIEHIGPACALSSITTAVALLSLCFSGNHGLIELGWIGALGVLGGFICLITGLPLGIFWAGRSGYFQTPPKPLSLGWLSKAAIATLRYQRLALFLGLVIAGLGLYAHQHIDNRFRLTDYLGDQSEVGTSESFIDNTYYGTTPLFVIVDMNPDLPLDHPSNEENLYKTGEAVTTVFGPGSFYSLADFADEIKKTGNNVDASLIDQLPQYLTARFIATDKKKVLVTIFSSANLSASKMQKNLAALEAELAKQGLAKQTRITGFPVLSGVIAPRLMDNLRTSLLIAVIMSIALIAIATRSLVLGLACLLPNLLPIVFVELVLFTAGIPLNMSITVALTVAFGIAVDDSIHMINQYLSNRKKHSDTLSIHGAIVEITPAVFITKLILASGLLIMSFSTLPAMAVFSIVVIMTLIFALIADLFQLPAYLALCAKRI